MKAHQLTTGTLLREFFLRERSAVPSGHNAIYWDEVVAQGLHKDLNPNDVVQFWHDSASGMLEQYLSETPASNTAIVSAYNSYYLDCGTGNEFGDDSWCDPFKTWRAIFFNDPIANITDPSHIKRVIGGVHPNPDPCRPFACY